MRGSIQPWWTVQNPSKAHFMNPADWRCLEPHKTGDFLLVSSLHRYPRHERMMEFMEATTSLWSASNAFSGEKPQKIHREAIYIPYKPYIALGFLWFSVGNPRPQVYPQGPPGRSVGWPCTWNWRKFPRPCVDVKREIPNVPWFSGLYRVEKGEITLQEAKWNKKVEFHRIRLTRKLYCN